MQDRRENQARSRRGLILSSRKNKLKKKNSLRHKHFIKQFIGKYEKSHFTLVLKARTRAKGNAVERSTPGGRWQARPWRQQRRRKAVASVRGGASADASSAWERICIAGYRALSDHPIAPLHRTPLLCSGGCAPPATPPPARLAPPNPSSNPLLCSPGYPPTSSRDTVWQVERRRPTRFGRKGGRGEAAASIWEHWKG